MREVDAVLPLVRADLPRARILFDSLEQHFEPLRRCFVVTPDDDVEHVAAAVPRERYEVVAESSIVPELPYFRSIAQLRARLRLVGPPFHGWFVQQLLKLAVAPRVRTRFYLTLDADVVCVRPTTYDDLVDDGRARVQTSPPNHPEWNDDAERVLGLPRSGIQYAVTPALFAREGVRELARHLAARDTRRRWRAYLLRNLPWTEYALYHTFLERTGRFDAYHVLAGEDAIYANGVWIESQFDEWDPNGGDAPFTVVQSATRIAPGRVREKLALARVRE